MSQGVPRSATYSFTAALLSRRYAATSAPIGDDLLRERGPGDFQGGALLRRHRLARRPLDYNARVLQRAAKPRLGRRSQVVFASFPGFQASQVFKADQG